MQSHRKRNIPLFTLILIAILLVSCLLTTYAGWGEKVLLYPGHLADPANWYRFFAYPLYLDGLLLWLLNAVSLLLAAWIFERRTSRLTALRIALLSAIVGGLVYATLNQQNPAAPLASPFTIGWGYLTAAALCGWRCWQGLSGFEKVVTLLAAGLLVLVPLLKFPAPSLLFTQMGVMIGVAAYSLGLKIFEKATFAS